MNLIPGLSLRVSAEDEEVGVDDCQLGEFAYDYVELTRHVTDGVPLASTPAVLSSSSSTAEKHSAEKMPV
jgi:Amt family ammonium transporter